MARKAGWDSIPDYSKVREQEPLRTALIEVKGQRHEVPVYKATYGSLLVELLGHIRWIPMDWEVGK